MKKSAFTLLCLTMIVLFSFYIRALNNVPDQMLGYDPVFQYRFTRYIVDFGQLPDWDELSYYVGRTVQASTAWLIFYLTAFVYGITSSFGWSLTTTATFCAALYGALISVPAFLLGRELSNKEGGLIAALLVACAPQILVRTYGSSFDTDQLALFFMLLTLWAGLYALKHKNVFSITLASGLFLLYNAAWAMSWYTVFFMFAACILYSVLRFVKDRKIDKPLWKACTAVILLSIAAATLVGLSPIQSIISLIGFATVPEKLIVNVSIAELQTINLFDLGTWMLAVGRFFTGDQVVDKLIFVSFITLAAFGLYRSYKTNKMNFSFLLAMLLITFLTLTRGIRFTEFSSAILLCVIGAGFGYLFYWARRDAFLLRFVYGLAILLVTFAIALGLQLAQYLGPSWDQNWQDAWTFIREKTPELALIGTWWDPGHMITGWAERRVIADGAHCGQQCLWGINDRITALGRIMATEDENVSIKLIRKYQGTSPKVYWIASDDLISKYQWIQYFGIGCDARVDRRCPLYSLLTYRGVYNTNGTTIVTYGPILVLETKYGLISVLTQYRNAALLSEILYYEGDKVQSNKITDAAIDEIKPLLKSVGYRLGNQTVPYTLWVSKGGKFAVLIPPNLRNTVFTKMFFLEGEGLKHFKQVFRNERVKIYEVEI